MFVSNIWDLGLNDLKLVCSILLAVMKSELIKLIFIFERNCISSLISLEIIFHVGCRRLILNYSFVFCISIAPWFGEYLVSPFKLDQVYRITKSHLRFGTWYIFVQLNHNSSNIETGWKYNKKNTIIIIVIISSISEISFDKRRSD